MSGRLGTIGIGSKVITEFGSEYERATRQQISNCGVNIIVVVITGAKKARQQTTFHWKAGK